MESFKFEEREVDWWFFTLLPILLIICVSFVIFSVSKDFSEVVILATEQLLLYSIILSSADLGLKSRSKEKQLQIAHPFSLILFSFTTLVCFYINKKEPDYLFIIYIYLFLSIIVAFVSIVLYNNNPESRNIGPGAITEAKGKNEDEADKKFKSKQAKTHLKVKWGEESE